MRLIHPIYLDIPMLVSFAAAIEGGLSFGSEVTRQESTSKVAEVDGSTHFGLSNLFGHFLNASAALEIQGKHEDSGKLYERSAKSHTEASIAILLYDKLRKDAGYIVDLKTLEAAREVEPGALIEVTGTVEKNAIDAVIDCIDAISILANLASDESGSTPNSSSGKRRGNPQPSKRKRENEGLRWPRFVGQPDGRAKVYSG